MSAKMSDGANSAVFLTQEEKYDVTLKIPDPDDLISTSYLDSYKIWIETKEDSSFQSKWVLGLKRKQVWERTLEKTVWKLLVYCKMEELRSTADVKGKFAQLILKDLSNHELDAVSCTPKSDFSLELKLGADLVAFTDSGGVATLNLTLVLFTEQAVALEDHLRTKGVTKARANLASLFNGESTDYDLTIVCGDGAELPCHKVMLKAQGPVLKAMLESDFSEAATGVVNITDVSRQAMEALLKYVYTGTLPADWMHPDVILDLTYVAGKYQMKVLLQLLDNVLGTVKALPLDVLRDLKNLTGKLSLKKAEALLQEQLVTRTISATTLDDIRAMFRSQE